MISETLLVVKHLEGISRAAISRFPELVIEFARVKSSVYALCKRSTLYYVRLTKNLRSLLHHHLRDCYFKFSKQSIGTIPIIITWFRDCIE